MLARLTAELAESRADILAIEVIERIPGTVVDELVVEVPDSDPIRLSRLIESLPGVIVESARVIEQAPSGTAVLELAERVSHTISDPLEVLVTGLPTALRAAWCVALSAGEGARTLTLAHSPGAPRIVAERLPWMPLEEPRRLAPAAWMPTSWRMRAALGGLELAACPLDSPFRALLLGRHTGMRFRKTELHQLVLLSSIALRRADPASRAG